MQTSVTKLQSLERSVDDIAVEYASGLEAYLSGDGEEELLRQAYELGRVAVRGGLGVLDVVEIHQHALNTLIPLMSPEEVAVQLRNALIFLEETLSPFELTHRGYRDAVELMHHVTRFASVASHEIKASLSAIQSSAGMLQEMLDARQDSPEMRLLTNILKGVSVLNQRTNDMTDIAGLYSGTLKIHPTEINVASFLREVVDQLEPEITRRGMELRLVVTESLPEVRFDPARIQQVITNLVQNAAKYAAKGGKIDIHATSRGANLSIEVKDYGNGLSPEDQRWLLSRDSSIRRDQRARGTGLGLMLCKQLVEAHHGRLSVTSQAGKGSTFEISLPLSSAGEIIRGPLESINR